MLLEQPGPWGRDAVTESRLDPGLARALDRAAAAAHLRLLLIRRPGRAGPGDPRPHTCFVAHTSRAGRWLERRRLDDPAELLELDMARVVAGERPGFGEEVTEPVYLVCTNGRHDRCCATYGRPLALALQASHGELVWESSHVGGDRFAGNLVCLPGGHYFGRVGPADAERVVALHRKGTIDLDHYRGCCVDPPAMQAAEWFARSRTGLTGVGDLELAGRDRLAGDVHAVRFRRPERRHPAGAGARHPDGRPPAAHLPQHPARAANALCAARAGRRARSLAAQAASSATLGCTVRP